MQNSKSVIPNTVNRIYELLDPKTGNFYTDEVNVIGNVYLPYQCLNEIPVQFGEVSGSFNCGNNNLVSLKGIPRIIYGSFLCQLNNLSSLEGIHKLIKKVDGCISVHGNPIISGGIGLILIEGISYIDSDIPAFEIINKYLGQGKKGLLLCQEELIEAGFKEYAKL